MIVSDVAGTTRDAIDTEIVHNDTEYVFIDTAGLRRKSKIKEDIERYSIIRTIAAIERADVVILVIDATEGVTEQDAKIAGVAHDRGRGLIIAVNKWDALEKDNSTVKEFTKKVRDILSFVPYAEIMFISALTGQRTNKIFDVLDVVIQNHALRIQTGVLNEILMEAVAMQQPPSDKGKRLKLFYMTQVSTKPPTFCAVCEQQRTDAFFLSALYREQDPGDFWFCRNSDPDFYQGKKRKGVKDTVYGLLAIILLVIGYFFGCFSTGYIVGKMNGHDIRTEGSGNIGTTNALRTMGAKGGALTFGGDLLKAFIPTLVVRFVMCPRMDMDLEYTYLFTLIVGLGVVIGHNFPFELHFKGGKGIAVSAAVIVASSAGTRLGWWMIAGGIVLFVAVVALTRYVSLGSLMVIWYFPIYTVCRFIKSPVAVYMIIVSMLFVILAYIKHAGNIKRLLNGTERKFGEKKQG